MTNMRSRFSASIVGSAVGDGVGYQTEFSSLREIHRRFGPAGVTDLPSGLAIYSDDSQNMIAVAEALLDSAGSSDPEIVMPIIARRFVEWSISPENDRAPGTTCMSACAALRAGTSWKQSAVKNSKGCGAAMRVGPIGLVYSDRTALREIARGSAKITHGHPAAAAAAHAAALAVRLLVDDCPPDELLRTLTVETACDSADWAAALEKVPLALAVTRRAEAGPEDVQQRGAERWRLGESWVADEAVASGLYSFLLAHERGEGFREAVIYAANSQGDSDTIATICGSLAGAAWGMGGRGVPPDWAARIENSVYLHALADRLYALVAE